MIKSAAASVTGSAVLGLGAQSAPADDAPVSTDFAALLDNRVAPRPEPAAERTPAPDAATTKQTRQAVGNAAGKKLPPARPDAAAKPDDTPADTTKTAEASTDDTETTDEAANALPPITTPIVLPGLVVPVSVTLPQTPEPATTAAAPAPASTPAPVAIKQSTTESLAQAAAVQAIRATLPGAKADKADAPVQQTSTAATKAVVDPALAKTAATDLPVVPVKADAVAVPTANAQPVPAAVVPASLPTRAEAIGPTIAPTAKPANDQAPAATPVATPAVTLMPGAPAAADQVRVTVAPAEQAAPSTAAQLASAQATSTAIGQTAVRAAPAPQPATEQTAAAQPTPVLPTQAAATAVQANAAAPRREAAADAPAAPAKAATAAPETPAAPVQAPSAMPAQPIFAMQDGPSFSQATAPVTSAPATTAVGQTGHDFATLVDRLVEARDAASPNSVHAAITHSEFGQVSLRFDQDSNGLSVSMSSADPEFARAVQASSAQSQMSSDTGNDRNGDRGTQRQDTSGSQQQTAGSAFSSQSQAQSSAYGREDRNSQAQNTRTGRTSGQPTQDADPADTRGGIYA